MISNEPTKNQGADSLVPELAEIVDKVTFSPEDIRDEDILALQTAGYSDDAVIEIINCASHWQQASDVWKP
ncbi:MAG: hypothetical protein GWO08_06700 [Gammaproteobacteria bacterium]|nr:hypothetical protein [Gammaproteobacteria bacterium]NIX56133.1 hypothetical protein [candidate division Zixibacteria bacterium]